MNTYCGNARPYIYVLFGEKDKAHADSIMEALSSRGHSLWYADTFNKTEEKRLAKAAALMVVLSRDFAESDILKKVVGQATKADIPIITVYREWVRLSPGLSMQLGTTLGVVRENFATEEEYLEKLCASPVLANLSVTAAQKAAARQTSMRFGLSAVGIVAALVLAVLLPFLMSSSMDLAELILPDSVLQDRKLYVYGDTTREDHSFYEMLDEAEDGETITYMVMEDGSRIQRGMLTDVTTFAQMTDLSELCLAGNAISNIVPLEQLTKLELLDLSGNNLIYTDLKSLAKLPALETLNLAYTGVTDLRPLRNCASLKTLYLSHDSALNLQDASLPGVEIVYVDTLVTDYWELKAACADEDVTRIFSMSAITIPEGETLTIPADTMVHHGQADFVNRGTLQVNGTLFIDEDNYTSDGALHIGDGGVFHVYSAMKQAVQNGAVTIEKGGNLIVDWGMLVFGGTTLENNGYMKANSMGAIALNFADVLNNGTIEASDGSDSMKILLESGLFDIEEEVTDVTALENILASALDGGTAHVSKGTIYGDAESFRGDGTVIGEITTQENVANQFSMMGMYWAQQAFGAEFTGKDVQFVMIP